MQIRGEPTASISAIPAPGDDLVARNSAKHAWMIAVALIILVTALRIAYMIWLSPYQLVGDEAYYWVQGRHLELCYDEKGPALPWIIYGCCKIFGDSEWAVRLPVVIAFALSAWGVGKLALNVARGDQRVGLLAVIIFCLVPAFQANAQLCTQDGPLITIWIALTAIGLRLIRRWHENKNVWLEWSLIWIVVGIGFLFKQTSLLFLPSFALYWLIHWRTLKLKAIFFAQQFVGVILFLITITPILIWNSRHGWPMLAHTLGHLGAGGDQAGLVNSGN
ncbi:MAG TPA: glycosyltransferase family 39 protein, partial [Tepidisphaeraceae bacterium]